MWGWCSVRSSVFSCKTTQGGSGAKAKAAEEPRRFIAEEILSPAMADGHSRNNGRFAT